MWPLGSRQTSLTGSNQSVSACLEERRCRKSSLDECRLETLCLFFLFLSLLQDVSSGKVKWQNGLSGNEVEFGMNRIRHENTTFAICFLGWLASPQSCCKQNTNMCQFRSPRSAWAGSKLVNDPVAYFLLVLFRKINCCPLCGNPFLPPFLSAQTPVPH